MGTLHTHMDTCKTRATHAPHQTTAHSTALLLPSPYLPSHTYIHLCLWIRTKALVHFPIQVDADVGHFQDGSGNVHQTVLQTIRTLHTDTHTQIHTLMHIHTTYSADYTQTVFEQRRMLVTLTTALPATVRSRSNHVCHIPPPYVSTPTIR